MSEPKFELGNLHITCGIEMRIEGDNIISSTPTIFPFHSYGFKRFVFQSLERFRQCDWGDTCDEDKKANDRAVKVGERILAVYTYPKTGEKIWIITEWDRSYTTVLFPDEY